MISVVVTLHNEEKSIISALQSVVAQTAQQWECVVIDNASTDASEYQVRSYLIDRRMRYYRLGQQVTPWDARRIGLDKTTGEWVVYMDGADYLESNALQALFLSVKKYGTLCGAANYAVMRGGEPRPHSYLRGMKVTGKQVAEGMISVVTGNSVFHRSVAHQPKEWIGYDFGYTDHLVSINGEVEAPLVKPRKKGFLSWF